MKKRLLVCLIFIVLILFTASPVYSAENGSAAAAAGAVLGTEVKAKAPSIYVFAAPQGADVVAPQNPIRLGSFLISDLFLEDGEWLSATVIPGALTHDRSGNTLPYQVQFNPPAVIGASNIGEAYQATVTIDANALAGAYRGTYQAVIWFCVISHPDGRVVWQGTSTLTIQVPYGAEWVEPDSPATETSSAPQPVSSKPSVSSAVSTPSRPKPSSQTSSAVSQGQPGQPPYMGTTAFRYGLPMAAILLTLAVLWLVIGHRRQRKNCR